MRNRNRMINKSKSWLEKYNSPRWRRERTKARRWVGMSTWVVS